MLKHLLMVLRKHADYSLRNSFTLWLASLCYYTYINCVSKFCIGKCQSHKVIITMFLDPLTSMNTYYKSRSVWFTTINPTNMCIKTNTKWVPNDFYIENKNRKIRKTQKYMFSKCLLRHDVVRVFVSSLVLVFVRAYLSWCP